MVLVPQTGSSSVEQPASLRTPLLPPTETSSRQYVYSYIPDEEANRPVSGYGALESIVVWSRPGLPLRGLIGFTRVRNLPARSMSGNEVRTVVIPTSLLPRVRGPEVAEPALNGTSSALAPASTEAPRLVVCSSCRYKEVEENATFCPMCGHHIIGFDYVGQQETSISDGVRF